MKLIINYLFVFGLIFLTGLISCSKNLKNAKTNFSVTEDENIAYLLDLMDNINANSPQTFYTEFNVEGLAKQKFKASGNVQYNDVPRKMRVIFHDAVFKSPITEIIQDRDVIKFYFPYENTLFIDNKSTIDLKFYSNIDLDFNFIYDLSTCRIPIIKNFSVNKGLESGDNRLEDNKLIILENDDYYETISFTKDIPDKILLLNKSTKEKIEVYLKNPLISKGILFYQSVRIISLNSDLKIDIQFNSTKFNIPLDLEKIVSLKLPKGGKVINKN